MKKEEEKKRFRDRFNGDALGKFISEYALTALVLGFVANGVATVLFMYGKLIVGERGQHLMGLVAFAYATLVFVIFLHKGIKDKVKG